MGEALLGRTGVYDPTIPKISWELKTDIVTETRQYTLPVCKNNKIKVICIGGGASVGNSVGGGSGNVNIADIDIIPGQNIQITIGSGGISSGWGSYNNGGTTSFGTYISATGGCIDGNGGAGGGSSSASVKGGTGFFGGGGGGGPASCGSSSYGGSSFINASNGGAGGTYGGGGGGGGSAPASTGSYLRNDICYGGKGGKGGSYGGNGASYTKYNISSQSINGTNTLSGDLFSVGFTGIGKGGTSPAWNYYGSGGGGGGGGYGGNGGNGGLGQWGEDTESVSYSGGAGGGGGGYGASGGNGNNTYGGGGGGFGGNGADGRAYAWGSSTSPGGGGGYGSSNYGAGGGGTAINGDNGKSGICIIQYYTGTISFFFMSLSIFICRNIKYSKKIIYELHESPRS